MLDGRGNGFEPFRVDHQPVEHRIAQIAFARACHVALVGGQYQVLIVAQVAGGSRQGGGLLRIAHAGKLGKGGAGLAAHLGNQLCRFCHKGLASMAATAI